MSTSFWPYDAGQLDGYLNPPFSISSITTLISNMVYYTEHTVRVADGVNVYYTDSGAPHSNDYTTLVLFHGSAFNGAIFLPLHEFAHMNNLRIVAWNRRDYRGSTKYSNEELDDLKAGRQVFQDRHALQLATFLADFITTNGTPKLSSDRKTGGFIILGWSFGNATTMSLLANPQAVPKHLYDLIEPYIMSVVIFDPPHSALGYPLPTYSGAYNPFNDPESTPEKPYQSFMRWVSSYFDHPDINSRDASGFDYRKSTENWTLKEWSNEQKALCIEETVANRSELPSYAPPMQTLLKIQTQNTFFNENIVPSHFPNTHIFYLACKNSPWFVLWGYGEISRSYTEAKSRGRTIRMTDFHLVDGANHFLPYENPELMLQLIVAGGHREFQA